MAKRVRVEYPGALYHVIQRGNNQEHVFERSENKKKLIDLLQKAVKVDGADLFAFVVMSNHYHLAIRTNFEPLNRVMHRINTTYSMFYNRIMDRSGHVFQGRYKATPIYDEKYLLSLVKYIHRNPVRAGICTRVQDYPWSSDPYYRKMEPGFIDYELLLNKLTNIRKNFLQEYNLLMEQDDDTGLSGLNDMPVLTDVDNAKNTEGFDKPSGKRKPLDDILMETVIDRKEYELIRQGSRIRKLTATKVNYARAAWEQGYSLHEIARHIGVSPVAVYKYISN